jgi:hypothetical protein
MDDKVRVRVNFCVNAFFKVRVHFSFCMSNLK